MSLIDDEYVPGSVFPYKGLLFVSGLFPNSRPALRTLLWDMLFLFRRCLVSGYVGAFPVGLLVRNSDFVCGPRSLLSRGSAV